MRSLFCALYDGGRLVSEPDETELKLEGPVNEDDCLTGCVYVLKSASRLPEVRAIPHLYKIGVSSVPLEERIAHARHEATYLMADVIPVRIVTIWMPARRKTCFTISLPPPAWIWKSGMGAGGCVVRGNGFPFLWGLLNR